MDKGSLQLLLSRGVSVEEIGRRFDRDPSTVSYWMRQHGLEAPNREKYAAKGGIDRDVLESQIAEGKSIATIASELQRSAATVRHWLAKHDLKTDAAVRRESSRCMETPDGEMIGVCPQHGQTMFRRDAEGRCRCLRCRQEYVVRRRRRVKATLIAEAGGCCETCGYHRYAGALHFHHRDRTQKSFGLSEAGFARSLNAARAEARKCALLCSNCHAEVEGGIALPPQKHDPG
jgi:transposase-like protein